MNRDRGLLHFNRLGDFQEWLRALGWEISDPRGEFEVFRARHRKWPGPVIFHARAGAREHVTAWGHGLILVRKYLRERGKS